MPEASERPGAPSIFDPVPDAGPDSAAEDDPAPPRRRGFRGFLGRHKALVVIFTILLVLVLVAGGWLGYLNSRLGAITRFEYNPGTVRAIPGESENILLIGVDDPDADQDLFAKLASGSWTPGQFRSDAIMVLHLDADHRQGQLVSIPRDSFVDVPNRGRTKINAAFSDGGPSELAQVVASVTGVRMDHAIVVDFTHFADLTTALGGVNLTIPETFTDPVTSITWNQGPIHLEGANALAYVRERYGLPRGDFDRIHRQQNLLRALFEKVLSVGTLSNPFRVTDLVRQLTGFVAVDDKLTPGKIRSLGLSSRHLRPSSLQGVTIPTTGTPTINGASVVTIDQAAVRDMFSAIARDRYDVWAQQQASVDTLPPPADVK